MKNHIQKCFFIIFAIVILLLCAACSHGGIVTENTGDTEATTQTTESVTEQVSLPTESANNSIKSLAPALRELGDNEIPILLTVQTGDTTCEAYRIAWNMDTNTLSDKEFCYALECESYDAFWDYIPRHWTGGATILGTANEDLTKSAANLRYEPLERRSIPINYGKCYLFSSENHFNLENRDGTVARVEIPEIPAEVYDCNKLTGDPYYATVDGDTAVVVYMRYEFAQDKGSDFVYCTYPVGQPEQAQWSVTEIPVEYHPDVILARWQGAYANGYLYFGTGTGFASLNLSTGEIGEVASVELIRPLSPDGSTENPQWGPEYPSIYASQNNVVFGKFYIYEADASTRLFFYAMKDNQVVEVVEVTDNVYTFYDADLNVLGTDDAYADINLVYMRWGKDD